MANVDNSCAHLEVEDVFTESQNTLADLYNLQKDIQENVYGYNFEELRENPLNEFRQFFDWNYHAIQDELRETFDALGGIKDGIGNGVWKPWKKSYHEKAPEMSFNSLSESDKKELQMELIDIQHFLFNMMLASGLTPADLMNMYFAKNKENRERQKRGY
jgi:phosphoribosyl-ATP pyrophosphohydrolase